MADMSTETMSEAAAEVPDYPMARAAGCPLAPASVALELNAVKPLSRVRIWDGSTPWLITGYDAIRSLFADSRASVDDRKPGYPHWNEGMLATVHKRPRSVFTADAEEHTTFRRMLSKPFTFKRVEGVCVPPSRRSPTTTSTRYWRARSRPIWSTRWHCRSRRW